MKKILYFLFLSVLISCSGDLTNREINKSKNIDLVEGSWHVNFQLSATNYVPINFTLTKRDTLYRVEFSNADEKILANSVSIVNDKIIIQDPVFNSWFEGNIINSTTIKGNWYKEGKEYYIPFIANHGNSARFVKPDNAKKPVTNISGKWEVDFSKNNPENHYQSIGQFQQDDDYLTGTFMTETGDYRFLEGNVYGDSVYLSCFDGSHLFLFKALIKNDSLIGTFWSGTHWEEPWVAIRNETFELTNPDSLTFLKDGFTELAFTFPNINRDNVSLTDKKYKGKVVIVNIMGPWCPNCKDETAYLTQLYNKNHDKGLEIIALSYDKTDDFEIAKQNIIKIKTFFNADYDFLIAGKADKITSAKLLPMLNHIMSYPTTIFIDKKGKIRKIRTGFYGPGTGSYYLRYTQQTNDLIAKLLAE